MHSSFCRADASLVFPFGNCRAFLKWTLMRLNVRVGGPTKRTKTLRRNTYVEHRSAKPAHSLMGSSNIHICARVAAGEGERARKRSERSTDRGHRHRPPGHEG